MNHQDQLEEQKNAGSQLDACIDTCSVCSKDRWCSRCLDKVCEEMWVEDNSAFHKCLQKMLLEQNTK
jgi:hypothetical protein